MKAINVCLALVALLFCLSATWAQQPSATNSKTTQPAEPLLTNAQEAGPTLLTYNEITQLYQQDIPPVPLRDKLNKLLTTPFVSNRAEASGIRPLKPNSPQTGKSLRVAEWNIERGLEFDAVRLAFTDAQGFSALMDQKNSKATADERARILDQIQLLKQADLLVLNEVDWGMNRTLFRNVAADLADALEMNYAYGWSLLRWIQLRWA